MFLSRDFLDFQKFERFENETDFPEIMPFCFLSFWLLTFQKKFWWRNPKRALVLNHLGNHSYVIKRKIKSSKLKLQKENKSISLSYLHD